MKGTRCHSLCLGVIYVQDETGQSQRSTRGADPAPPRRSSRQSRPPCSAGSNTVSQDLMVNVSGWTSFTSAAGRTSRLKLWSGFCPCDQSPDRTAAYASGNRQRQRVDRSGAPLMAKYSRLMRSGVIEAWVNHRSQHATSRIQTSRRSTGPWRSVGTNSTNGNGRLSAVGVHESIRK